MSSCHLTYNYTVDILKRISLYIFYFLLAYMPFHIFLSTWLGTSFGILDFVKIAKDILLVAGSVLAFIPSVRQNWFKQLLKDRLVQLILAYTALTVLLAIIKPIDQDAELLGLVYNTRFLLFFLYAVLLTHLFDAKHLLKTISTSCARRCSTCALFRHSSIHTTFQIPHSHMLGIHGKTEFYPPFS